MYNNVGCNCRQDSSSLACALAVVVRFGLQGRDNKLLLICKEAATLVDTMELIARRSCANRASLSRSVSLRDRNEVAVLLDSVSCMSENTLENVRRCEAK